MCRSAAVTVCDAVMVQTVELESQEGKKTTSAAGWRWPAWSSAGPATHTKAEMFFLQFLPIFLIKNQAWTSE